MKEVVKRSSCPISFCLDFLGDKWSLLIIRDMILDDKTTFGEFLDSDEHIATNILTTRLKMLEAAGFVIKYPLEGKMRTGYCLTKKGIDLVPLITEMSLWGAKYSDSYSQKELIIAFKKDRDSTIKGIKDKLSKKYQTIQKRVLS